MNFGLLGIGCQNRLAIDIITEIDVLDTVHWPSIFDNNESWVSNSQATLFGDLTIQCLFRCLTSINTATDKRIVSLPEFVAPHEQQMLVLDHDGADDLSHGF